MVSSFEEEVMFDIPEAVKTVLTFGGMGLLVSVAGVVVSLNSWQARVNEKVFGPSTLKERRRFALLAIVLGTSLFTLIGVWAAWSSSRG